MESERTRLPFRELCCVFFSLQFSALIQTLITSIQMQGTQGEKLHFTLLRVSFKTQVLTRTRTRTRTRTLTCIEFMPKPYPIESLYTVCVLVDPEGTIHF